MYNGTCIFVTKVYDRPGSITVMIFSLRFDLIKLACFCYSARI